MIYVDLNKVHLLTELGTNQEYVPNEVLTKQAAPDIVGLCYNLDNLIILISIHHRDDDDRVKYSHGNSLWLYTAGNVNTASAC